MRINTCLFRGLFFVAIFGACSQSMAYAADGTKITDIVQAASAAISTIVAFFIFLVSRKQVKIYERQSEILQNQLDITRNVVEAATSANEISREIYILENRTWLDFKIDGPAKLEILGKGLLVDLNFLVENVGKNVATNISIDAALREAREINELPLNPESVPEFLENRASDNAVRMVRSILPKNKTPLRKTFCFDAQAIGNKNIGGPETIGLSEHEMYAKVKLSFVIAIRILYQTAHDKSSYETVKIFKIIGTHGLYSFARLPGQDSDLGQFEMEEHREIAGWAK